MTLENLVGVSIEKITPLKQTVRRLLDGATRHIADAKVKTISDETLFGSAYTAIRMLADAGLHAHGFRHRHRCDQFGAHVARGHKRMLPRSARLAVGSLRE